MDKRKEALYQFMDSFNDDSLGDGAWQRLLEHSVTIYNAAMNTDYDSFDEWMNYVEWKSEK